MINYPLNSLFRQIGISLNGRVINSSDGHHGYRSYIETLLNFSQNSKDTFLKSSGWTEEGTNMDNINENLEIYERRKLMKNSKVLELYGRIHGDMINQPLLLINNVDFRLKLQMHRPEFFILYENEENEPILKVLDATLYMKSCTINPKILLSHQMLLEKTSCNYFYKSVTVKPFTLSNQGSSMISIDNIVLGVLPTSIWIMFVDGDSYNGDYKLNPFIFKHNYIESFSLFVNSSQVNEPIVTDFENSDISARAYSNIFSATGTLHTSGANLITKEMFSNGYFLLGFDLTNDSSCTNVCSSMSNTGNIRLEARFGRPLDKVITCLAYLQYDTSLSISKNRSVTINY